jgi:sugar phosphate isomerase/epimerase
MEYLNTRACFKGKFPFKIGTTSFIYPDTYAGNVARLGSFFDEIELLFFESDPPDNLPDKDEIQILAQLGHDLDIAYNVHLPYDVDPGHADDRVRHHAVDILKTVFDLSVPLTPSTHTLHLPLERPDPDPGFLKKWRKNLRESFKQLLDHGLSGHLISIENLNYPFHWIEDIVFEFDLGICLDIGHLIAREFDINLAFQKYADRIRIIHPHAVDGPKDHLGMDRLMENRRSEITRILERFTGTVSIEVFSFENLASSLFFFESLRAEESRSSKISKKGGCCEHESRLVKTHQKAGATDAAEIFSRSIQAL